MVRVNISGGQLYIDAETMLTMSRMRGSDSILNEGIPLEAVLLHMRERARAGNPRALAFLKAFEAELRERLKEQGE